MKFGEFFLKYIFHKAVQTIITWPEYQLHTIWWNLKVTNASVTYVGYMPKCNELLRRETPDFIGPDLWPVNSPDLNPINNRIWGLIQESVYQTAIRDIDNLKQRLTCVWAELKQSVVDKAIEQWRPRLRACVRAKGQHFEQLLHWTLLFLV